MSRLQCRASIVGAAVVVALLSSRAADAQSIRAHRPTMDPGDKFYDLVTGVKYDRMNKAMAERQLECLQAKLRRDSERCKPGAVECDVRRINNLRYRIEVDIWLIRKLSLQDPGYYPPRTDPVSCAAIAEATRPAGSPPLRP